MFKFSGKKNIFFIHKVFNYSYFLSDVLINYFGNFKTFKYNFMCQTDIYLLNSSIAHF